MSYYPNTRIYAGDTGSIDAFGRWRTSNPYTLFDSKQINDNLPLIYDEVDSGGSESATHSVSDSAVTMSVTSNAEYVIRQTKTRFNYQPGKSQQIFCTFVLGTTTANVVKRVGYYNSSTTGPYTASIDGLYLEDNGTNIGLVVSKAGTPTRVAQASWSLDVMDGTGPSGITVDWTKAQILMIDFEWLGVGRVRWALVIDGAIYYVHETNNANSVASVYMSSPNHSIRYEIRSSGGSSSLVHICSAVASEGGVEEIGINQTHNNGNTVITAGTNTITYALLGIGLKAAYSDTIAIPTGASCIATTNNDYFLMKLILNPTVAGTFTYGDKTNSVCQVATGVATNTVTGGTVLWSSYASVSSQSIQIDSRALPRIGMSIAGVSDKAVLCIQPVSGSQAVLASLNWIEQL